MKELTRSERREIKTLITNKNPGCANYDRDYGCLPADAPCFMLTDTVGHICTYFREAVLPLNPTLAAALNGKAVEMKSCAICGKQFAVNGRQLYCSDKCQSIGMKNKERAKKKKQREKVRSNVPI